MEVIKEDFQWGIQPNLRCIKNKRLGLYTIEDGTGLKNVRDINSSVGAVSSDDGNIPSLPSLPEAFFADYSDADEDGHSNICTILVLHQRLKQESFKEDETKISTSCKWYCNRGNEVPVIKRTMVMLEKFVNFFILQSIASNLPSFHDRLNARNLHQNRQQWSGMKSTSIRCIHQKASVPVYWWYGEKITHWLWYFFMYWEKNRLQYLNSM